MAAGVHSLGYFLFEVSDLDAWDHFLTQVIGVERGEALGEGLVPYRTDDRAARILLRRGPADDLIALGFEVAGTMIFPDHHDYPEEDLAAIEEAVTDLQAAAVLTTAKDRAVARPCFTVTRMVKAVLVVVR